MRRGEGREWEEKPWLSLQSEKPKAVAVDEI